jgi:uncharacterized protein YbjT (DUF2867 family)
LAPAAPRRSAPADIAAVAALALTEDGHQGREYALTGDEAFTVTEQVRVLAEAIGRDIEVREVATPAQTEQTSPRRTSSVIPCRVARYSMVVQACPGR